MSQLNLSQRIQSIVKLVPKETQELWDICCDHGIIGKQFLNRELKHIYFLDQVPSIIKNLRQTLEDSYITSFDILLDDARKINWYKYKKKGVSTKIIVGIGADLLIDILSQIDSHQKDYFIVSAHQNSYKLRQYLIKSDYKLINEILIEESGRFYEILLVHPQLGESINLVGGDKLWANKNSKKYLIKQIELFKIKAKYSADYDHILKKYLKDY